MNDRMKKLFAAGGPTKDGTVVLTHWSQHTVPHRRSAADVFIRERLNNRRLQKKRFIARARRDVA